MNEHDATSEAKANKERTNEDDPVDRVSESTTDQTREGGLPDGVESAEDLKEGLFRWKALIGLPIVLALAWLGLVFGGDALVKTAVKESLRQSFGSHTKVTIDRAELRLFPTRIIVTGLTAEHPKEPLYRETLKDDLAKLDEDDWQTFMELKEFSAKASLFPLFAGRVDLSEVVIDTPRFVPQATTPLLSKDSPKTEEGESLQIGNLTIPNTEDLPIEDLREVLSTYEEYHDDPVVQEIIELAQDMFRDSSDDEEEKREEQRPDLPASPSYIMQAQAKAGRPSFVMHTATLKGGRIVFDDDGLKGNGQQRSVSSIDDLTLTMKNATSAPSQFGQAMTLSGNAKLAGSEAREIAVSFTWPADPTVDPLLLDVALGNIDLPDILDMTPKNGRLAIEIYPRQHALAPEMLALRVEADLPDGGTFVASLWSPLSQNAGALGLSLALKDVSLEVISAALGDLPFRIDPYDPTGEKQRVTLSTVSAEGLDAARHPQDPRSAWRFGKTGTELFLLIDAHRLRLMPKPGEKILGLPGEEVCGAFNSYSEEMFAAGESMRFRFGFGKDGFSLQEPGSRGLIDGLINAHEIEAKRLESWIDGVTFADGGSLDLQSIDLDGNERGPDSLGADGYSLADMRIAARPQGLTIGQTTGSVLGIPGKQFMQAWNATLGKEDDKPAPQFGVRLTDANGSMSPNLESGSVRPLVEAIADGMALKLSDIKGQRDLGGIVFNDDLQIALMSPERTSDSVPPVEGEELAGLTFEARLKNAKLDPGKQPKQIVGVPSQYFVFAWNKYVEGLEDGVPARVKLFNDSGSFSPGLSVEPSELTPEIEKSLGVESLTENPEQLVKLFGKDFGEYTKKLDEKGILGGDIKKALEGGGIKLPGFGDKKSQGDGENKPEKPKLPENPLKGLGGILD